MWKCLDEFVKLGALFSFLLVVTIQTGSAGGYFFSDFSFRELKVSNVDVENQTALLKSPDGEVARLTIGDTVGRKGYTITKITETVIEVEGYPDASKSKIKSCIPVVPIFFINPNHSPEN